MALQETLAVIPARFASTRFPGKPLADIAGKTMIQRVYERADSCPDIARVVVATDDARIQEAVTAFGGEAVMTRADHPTGTDRIAEAIEGIDGDIIVNVQGDEPLIPPKVLSQLVMKMRSTGVEMATAAVPFSKTDRDAADPNAVKVVVGGGGFALYFSRSRIPFCRQGGLPVEPLLHWGLYAYRRDFLQAFVGWPRTRLETCEMLEQLRALENGARIFVLQTDQQSVGVDVPADVLLVERLLRERGLE